MSDAGIRPNQFRHAGEIVTPGRYRDGRWETFEPAPPVPLLLGGRIWFLRPGLTFTPYANPRACNAHCAFCSEELLRHDASRLTAKTVIGDRDRWFSALDRVWTDLRTFPLGLSLSGLEATADAAWFLRLMDLVDAHRALFVEKVLYSNGSGFAHDGSGAQLVAALARTGFDRVELSRAHFDEQTNQQIMRFEKDQPVWRAAAFDDVVRRLQGAGVSVKLSCILNREGVRTIDDVEAHLAHARSLGVKRVVFRELSALGDLYVENRETRWIAANRVAVRDLMEAVLPSSVETGQGASSTTSPRPGWELTGVTAGYYYYNEVYRVADIDVILEASSYVAHHDVLQSGVLQKLVFHSTGDLCGDWVPDALVVGNWMHGP